MSNELGTLSKSTEPPEPPVYASAVVMRCPHKPLQRDQNVPDSSSELIVDPAETGRVWDVAMHVFCILVDLGFEA
mgnify:CR=1 FL=1|jgi:hypothetical protein|tara:strand:- start:9944 stop:10168 length:225 start_codon:yes stop_codon:yes gene_type:complete